MKNIIGAGIVLILVAAGGYVFMQRNSMSLSDVPTNQMGTVTSGENPTPGSPVHNLPVEPAAAAARTDLATRLGIDTGSIVIMSVQPETWSDGCLGLGGPAESCLAALTEGFSVELLASGESYKYRTDAIGAQVRAEVR